MKSRLISISILLSILIIFQCIKVFADPFISYPGTRAKAMGGAFVAVADDSSSCWYNPAGIANWGFDFTLEYSQAPSYNNDKYDNTGDSFFVGVKLGAERRGGLGLYFYSPYSIAYSFNVTEDNANFDYLYGYLDETVYIFGLTISMGSENAKIGFSFESVYLDFSDSKFYRVVDNNTYLIDPDKLDVSQGYSLSVGILLNPLRLEKNKLDFKIGAAYHLPSFGHTESYSKEYEKELADKVIFRKPASYDIGLSLTLPLGKYAYLILSGQYGETDYSKVNENFDWKYRKFSAGGELRLVIINSILSLRWGGYSSKSTQDDEVLGITGGIGIGIGQHFTIEGSYERRKWRSFNENISIDLFSFSINFCFG